MQSNSRQPLLRQLPSIDALIKLPESTRLQEEFGRPLTLTALRTALADTRQAIENGELDQTKLTYWAL